MHRIDHEARIHRGNFRMAEWAGRSAVPAGGLCSAIMPGLPVVHHTPSPALQEMFGAAVSGARTDEVAGNGQGVDVVIRPALTAVAVDALEADGYLPGTPVISTY
jgi:hypothetical protein